MFRYGKKYEIELQKIYLEIGIQETIYSHYSKDQNKCLLLRDSLYKNNYEGYMSLSDAQNNNKILALWVRRKNGTNRVEGKEVTASEALLYIKNNMQEDFPF